MPHLDLLLGVLQHLLPVLLHQAADEHVGSDGDSAQGDVWNRPQATSSEGRTQEVGEEDRDTARGTSGEVEYRRRRQTIVSMWKVMVRPEQHESAISALLSIHKFQD